MWIKKKKILFSTGMFPFYCAALLLEHLEFNRKSLRLYSSITSVSLHIFLVERQQARIVAASGDTDAFGS